MDSPSASWPAPTSDVNDELGELLAACRQLTLSILTVSRDGEDVDMWRARVRMAREHVEEASGALNGGIEPDGTVQDLSRIAATLSTRLVHDLLVDDERKRADEVEGRVAKTRDRNGFHGFTWAIPLPDLLAFLQMQQKSGVLKVNIGTELISLIFDRGDLIHACSDNSPPGFRLGEILVERGVLDHKRLEQFFMSYSSSPGRLGDALEEQGLITREQLRGALDVQIEKIFHRLFATQDAYYTFREGHLEDTVQIRRNVLQLLLETCRVNDESRTDPSIRE